MRKRTESTIPQHMLTFVGCHCWLFSCLFQLPEAAHIPCLVVPFSIFKSSSVAPSNLSSWRLLPSSHLLLWLPCPSYKGPWGYLGSTQVIQHNPPISRSLTLSYLQSPFRHEKQHIHRPQGLRCGHLRGGSEGIILPAGRDKKAVQPNHQIATASCNTGNTWHPRGLEVTLVGPVVC